MKRLLCAAVIAFAIPNEAQARECADLWSWLDRGYRRVIDTYEQGGKQYVAVLSGVGGWAGIGLAAGLTDPTAGLGAVGGYAALSNYTALGGTLTVFSLPQ